MNVNVNAQNSDNVDNYIKVKALEAGAPKARSGGVAFLISLAVMFLTGGLFGCAGHLYLGQGGRGAGIYYGSFAAGWGGLIAGTLLMSHEVTAIAATGGLLLFAGLLGSTVLGIWWIVDHFNVAEEQAIKAKAYWSKFQNS